jgi:hypothetical protein
MLACNPPRDDRHWVPAGYVDSERLREGLGALKERDTAERTPGK